MLAHRPATPSPQRFTDTATGTPPSAMSTPTCYSSVDSHPTLDRLHLAASRMESGGAGSRFTEREWDAICLAGWIRLRVVIMIPQATGSCLLSSRSFLWLRARRLRRVRQLRQVRLLDATVAPCLIHEFTMSSFFNPFHQSCEVVQRHLRSGDL